MEDEEEVLEKLEEQAKDPHHQYVKSKNLPYIKNLIFFIIVTYLGIALRHYLHKFVSLVGSFVGIFEISVFPLSMIIVINKKKQRVSTRFIVAQVLCSIVFVAIAFTSFLVILTHSDH